MAYGQGIISARRLWQAARKNCLYDKSISSVTEEGHAGVLQHLSLDKDHHKDDGRDGRVSSSCRHEGSLESNGSLGLPVPHT